MLAGGGGGALIKEGPTLYLNVEVVYNRNLGHRGRRYICWLPRSPWTSAPPPCPAAQEMYYSLNSLRGVI